jgi:hypothetical protein
MKGEWRARVFGGIICFLTLLLGISSIGFCLTISNDPVFLGVESVGINTTPSDGWSLTVLGGGGAITGTSNNGTAISGNGYSAGVSGSSASGNGVYGSSTSGYAGYFQGNVNVTEQVTASYFSGNGAGLTNVVPAAGTVSTDKIASGAVTTDKISSSNVTSDKIASGAVTSAKLASNAVTPVNVAFYSNVAIVAPSGGDYDNPATAMSNYSSWCGTPSDTNPCLLKIMPGVYDIGTSSVVMQPYIDIEGSGENVTFIKGIAAGFGLLYTKQNAEIRFCTINKTGGSTAIYNGSNGANITNVTVISSSGSTDNFGIFNFYHSKLTMTNVKVTISCGGTYCYGIHNENVASIIMTNSTVDASGGTYCHAIHNQTSSSITMTNVKATASSGTGHNHGIDNASSSSLVMTNSEVAASGTQSYGVYNGATAYINHSLVRGVTGTIFSFSGYSTLVGNSQLDGGAVAGAGTPTCAGVYDENYTFYASTCP